MKNYYMLVAAVCLHLISFGQSDTTGNNKRSGTERDTIRIGNMIIIKNKDYRTKTDTTIVDVKYLRKKLSNLSTNWGIIDLGFNNFTDNTNYASASTQQFAPGSTKDWFNLRNGKSINVNIWFVMQRLNIIKHVVNLKYGLGLELNNFRYEEDIVFSKNPTIINKNPLINYSKNKLATDYLTVPLMLNFNFTPRKDNFSTFGLSVGVSGGYLYTSRQKLISGENGKEKNKNNFDLRPYKINYIAELQLGPVKVYGSMATQSMFEKGLDQTPYSVGLRLS
ncbi:MAG: outer membrane beta-barrel protein, partial [Chitinophagaceae bacterium]